MSVRFVQCTYCNLCCLLNKSTLLLKKKSVYCGFFFYNGVICVKPSEVQNIYEISKSFSSVILKCCK